MPTTQPRCSHLLLLLLLARQPQVPAAQVMDFLFETWKIYGDQCTHNLSLLPPPTELVCNRTFDKYACWPDTPVNTTANLSCPWYLPWYHKVQHRLVFKTCGPDGQWVRGPQGQPWRNASQCQMDQDELEDQKEVVKMYSSFQVMYTVGYCLSLGALFLALAILLGLSQLHCTRNYIHMNLFASFVLKASSVLATDALLQTRYSQKVGDDLSVSIWLSDQAVASCRVAVVFMQYGIVANYCWLLVEGLYLHSVLHRAAFQEDGFFPLYVGIGWGAPLLFVIPWAVVKCLFENIQCWTSNDNMGFWWILRFPVFLAILINFLIFIHTVHILLSKLRAHQMHCIDYKFRLAKSTLTLVPLLGVHEVVFAFVTDEHAQGALRSTKLFFDLFFSSIQGLLVAVLYCFLNKEVQSELLRRWHRWRVDTGLREELRLGSRSAPPSHGPPSEERLLTSTCSEGPRLDPSLETPSAHSLPGPESPFWSLGTPLG
ncbi:PREDICTED: glucagon receptor [Elephantulus edwardii]|uniref:glucagon receptor n=1 Tax=Elephantulus edwardii TaxID=28737 RepID=UPI0003F063CA|nr:PREDICTED: glucagon receptor [Elephantulus edwardii]